MDEVEPTCDICGEPEDTRVGWFENDWNGETGNHLSCERDTFTFGDAMNLPGSPIDRTKSKPKLQLSGQDGNAFFIIGRGMQALRRAGYSEEDINKFEAEATSGDYDNVLATAMKWFDWS